MLLLVVIRKNAVCKHWLNEVSVVVEVQAIGSIRQDVAYTILA